MAPPRKRKPALGPSQQNIRGTLKSTSRRSDFQKEVIGWTVGGGADREKKRHGGGTIPPAVMVNNPMYCFNWKYNVLMHSCGANLLNENSRCTLPQRATARPVVNLVHLLFFIQMHNSVTVSNRAFLYHNTLRRDPLWNSVSAIFIQTPKNPVSDYTKSVTCIMRSCCDWFEK